MKKIIVICLLACLVLSCKKSTDAKEWFSTEAEKNKALLLIAPYVLPLPDDISDSLWFYAEAVVERHQKTLDENKVKLERYFIDANDSMRFYLVNSRDYSSLFEHYKLYGGMYKVKNGKVDSLVELFISPRLTKEETSEKGEALFSQIIKDRSIGEFYGNKNYVEWPYKGLAYDVAKKKWMMTSDNEMFFLQEAKDSVARENKILSDEIKSRDSIK